MRKVMKNLNTYQSKLLKAVLLKISQKYLIKYAKIIHIQGCFILFSGGPLCLLNPVQHQFLCWTPGIWWMQSWLMVGFNDLIGLFQHKWFYESINLKRKIKEHTTTALYIGINAFWKS